jgi:SAM-dependent methyltransferase
MMKRMTKLARGALREARGRAVQVASAVSRRLAPQAAIAPRDELFAYWRQPEPEGNVPAALLDQEVRSRALLSMLGQFFGTGWSDIERRDPASGSKDWAILEVGCGAGRNLAYLYDHGYTNLVGIEINPHAIALLRQTYPQLKDVTIHEGPAEEVLPTLADDQFKVAFTMSTLQHIHPDSVAVFDHLTRVAARLLVIEGAPRRTRRQYPHDYDEIFTSRGMVKLSTWSMTRVRGAGLSFAQHVGRRYRRTDSQARLHEFWRQPTPAGNNPNDYIRVTGRSKALLEIISDLPKDARILEVGCNVGRNLAYLYDNGYTGVEGVEINPHAVELLRRTFPQLADTQIHIGAAGEVLPKFADDEFDLVYTMAVLEHIHPDESSVFDDMARIGKHVLAIEPKGRLSHRQFPHDIPKVFAERGLTLVSDKSMADFPSNANDPTMKAFYAFRFARPEGWTHARR